MAKKRSNLVWWPVLLVGLLLLFAAYWYYGRRPPRSALNQDWYQGVVYERIPLTEPRPILLHLVTIDLTAPGISFVTTEPDASGGMEMVAQTVGWFAAEYETQLAINASFFYPFHSKNPFDYYPHVGDPVDVRGLAIADGQLYSDDNPDSPTLCIQGVQVSIQKAGCPAETEIGLSTIHLLQFAGELEPVDDVEVAPRTAIAVDPSGKTVWLLIVDGRQPGYSEGMTLAEVGDFLAEQGAYSALKFDGGGSSTLIANDGDRFWTVNSSIHTRIPMRLRPVANHLGVYALPIE